jgi:hypothetical protein
MPMQKISTSLKKTDLFNEKKGIESPSQFQPSSISLQKILRFASTYRAQKVVDNQYVEWYLN